MDEHVVPALTLDEAEALGSVEPFHCSFFFHKPSPDKRPVVAARGRRFGRSVMLRHEVSHSQGVRFNRRLPEAILSSLGNTGPLRLVPPDMVGFSVEGRNPCHARRSGGTTFRRITQKLPRPNGGKRRDGSRRGKKECLRHAREMCKLSSEAQRCFPSDSWQVTPLFHRGALHTDLVFVTPR